MITWGISANSHDAALAVFKHQPWNKNSMELLYASHSERYSGVKNDAHLNSEIVRDALKYGEPNEVIWYERPLIKTFRQIRAGQGFRFRENNVRNYLAHYGINTPIRYIDHHLAHAAAGYILVLLEKPLSFVLTQLANLIHLVYGMRPKKKVSKKFTYKDTPTHWDSGTPQ